MIRLEKNRDKTGIITTGETGKQELKFSAHQTGFISYLSLDINAIIQHIVVCTIMC